MEINLVALELQWGIMAIIGFIGGFFFYKLCRASPIDNSSKRSME